MESLFLVIDRSGGCIRLAIVVKTAILVVSGLLRVEEEYRAYEEI